MHIPLNQRLGLNRQQAIDYLGVKGTYFDKSIRPKLIGIKMGTSTIFDQIKLDSVFEELMMATGDVGPTEKGLEKWPKEPLVSRKQKMGAGESIRPTKELDFRDVLKRIKQRKHGC
jgi:hypothetical protein